MFSVIKVQEIDPDIQIFVSIFGPPNSFKILYYQNFDMTSFSSFSLFMTYFAYYRTQNSRVHPSLNTSRNESSCTGGQQSCSGESKETVIARTPVSISKDVCTDAFKMSFCQLIIAL